MNNLPPGFPFQNTASPSPAAQAPSVPGNLPPGFAAPAAMPQRQSRYSGVALPGARYPIPASGYTYECEVTKTSLVSKGRGSAETYVVEFKTIESNNPAEQPGTQHGYPIGLEYESGFGAVAQFVLAACGFRSESEFAAAGGNLEAIATASETQEQLLAGRRFKVTSYDHVRTEKSKTPGKVDTRLQFEPPTSV